jgi:hypothetical protein
MTIALLVSDPSGAKSRFHARLDKRGEAYSDDRVFLEQGGNRYIEIDSPHTIYAPSFWAGLAAILLNFMHFLIWFLVLWFVLQYDVGSALGGAFGLGLVTMLAVMPLLFDSNRVV